MNKHDFVAGAVVGALYGAALVYVLRDTEPVPHEPTQARLVQAHMIASRYPLSVEHVFDWLARCADSDVVHAACHALVSGDPFLAEATIAAGERRAKAQQA